MSDILGRIPTLALWVVDSRYFSSVQIRIEPDVLASYLYSDAALGPAQVLVDLDWCPSVVHSESICFLVHRDDRCFPSLRVRWCQVSRVFLTYPRMFPFLECCYLHTHLLSLYIIVSSANSIPFGYIIASVHFMNLLSPSNGQLDSITCRGSCPSNR